MSALIPTSDAEARAERIRAGYAAWKARGGHGEELLPSDWVAPQPRRKPADRPVYFIGDSRGHIKIGVAERPADRLNDLQTANPLPLTLLGQTAQGGERLERALHAELVPFRVLGEWFRDCPQVREVIAREVTA